LDYEYLIVLCFFIADSLFRIEDDEFNLADMTFMIVVCLFIVMDVSVG